VDQRGIDATVLAEHARIRRTARPLSPEQLGAWLIQQRFARRLPDGRLAPTRAAVELAGALRQLEGDDPYPRTWVRRRA
jgi:hypothetical protein